MKLVNALSGMALMCGLAACDSPSAPQDFDRRSGDVMLGRVIVQERDSVTITDWARATFIREDYEDNQYILKERAAFPVASIAINGNRLPFLIPDSLIYGFESTSRSLRLAVGRQIVDVQGDGAFSSYREEVIVPTDARITSPRPGDTVSMSRGFWLEWDNHGSKGDHVDVELASEARPRLTLSPTGGTDDDGRMFVKEWDLGLMEPGPARVILVRQNITQRWIAGIDLSRTWATSTVILPVVFVE